MKGMKKIVFLGLIGFTLIGCSSSPVSNDAALNVPEQRIYNQDIFIKKENSGMVIIKRDKGFVSSACSDSLFVDGVKIADLNPAEKVVIYPLLGKRIFSMVANGVCGGGMVEVEGDVEKSQILTYRIAHSLNGGYGIFRTAF